MYIIRQDNFINYIFLYCYCLYLNKILILGNLFIYVAFFFTSSFFFFLATVTPASHHVTGTVGAWSRSSVTVSKPVSSLKAHSRNISVDWDPFGEDSPPGAGEGSSTQAGNSSDGLKSSEQCPAEPEPPVEPVVFEQLPLLKPSSNRVYRRPQNKGMDSSGTGDVPVPAVSSTPASVLVKSTAAGVTGSSEVKPAGRGRVRDYTVSSPVLCVCV